MIKSICVQPPLPARSATVLVWQRAVNRQPGYRSGNSKGRSLSCYYFPENFKFSKKNSPHFLTFSKSLDPIELWNFKVIFNIQYHFYKLQYVLHNNYVDSQTLSESNDLQKLLFHGPAHRRAAAPAGPRSYCCGMHRAVNRQPGNRSGNSKGKSPSCYYFPENLKFFKKISSFSTFSKVWIL